MVGHSYKLNLPKSYKVSRVFHADRLRRDPENPLPGQANTPEPAIETNGELEWEVERIISSRISRGTLEYQVEWNGWDPDETWYPASNFKNAPLRVRDYHEKNPSEAGPPLRLDQWILHSEDDSILTDHPDDNLPVGTNEGRKTRRRRA